MLARTSLIPAGNVSMVSHQLKAVTSLGQDAPVVMEIGPYRIVERVDVALASLAIRRGCNDAFLKASKSAKLPLADIARAQSGAVYHCFWLSSEQWMIEAPFASHEDITAHLKSIFGNAASITEQTDAWVRFDVTAKDLQPLFERLCNQDVAAAPIDFATRTMIDHLGCYVIKRAASEITIYGPRSSAQSLLHAIEAAANAIV